MNNLQFTFSGLIKKATALGLVFCVCVNSVGFAYAEEEKDVEEKIAEYCEENLGAGWETFKTNIKEEDYKKRYKDIKDEYHDDVNTLFADAVNGMLEIVDEEGDLSKVCSESSIKDKMKTVITTYELSQKSLCRYARYQATLRARNNYILGQDIKNEDIEDVMGGSLNTRLDIYQGLQLFQEQLESELVVSKTSLSKTLAAYNEMVIMYPLHLRLRCIISDLLIFRKELQKLVNIFFCLDRFIDAASDNLN